MEPSLSRPGTDVFSLLSLSLVFFLTHNALGEQRNQCSQRERSQNVCAACIAYTAEW